MGSNSKSHGHQSENPHEQRVLGTVTKGDSVSSSYRYLDPHGNRGKGSGVWSMTCGDGQDFCSAASCISFRESGLRLIQGLHDFVSLAACL